MIGPYVPVTVRPAIMLENGTTVSGSVLRQRYELNGYKFDIYKSLDGRALGFAKVTAIHIALGLGDEFKVR